MLFFIDLCCFKLYFVRNNKKIQSKSTGKIMEKRYAGIDQGTTATKLLILSENGQIDSCFQKEHKQIMPKKGWVEHDGDEIYKNICEAIDYAGNIDAIGIDHQGESIVAWHSETKEALYNVIVWQDNRTEAWLNNLKSDGVEKRVFEKTALPLDPYFPASKMRWILENIPAAQKALQQGKLRMGTMESFFIDRLTGHFQTDFNSASRTSLMNINTLQWDEELCEIFGIPMSILPPIVPNVGDFGHYKNIPITSTIIDQFASIYAHQCRKEGDAKITFGTGAFLQILTGALKNQDPQNGLLAALCWKFDKDEPMFGLDGGVYNAGSAINWLKSLGLFQNYEKLNSFSKNAAIERELIFIPALSGLGCPYWDRTASGVFFGLSLETKKEDMLQACLEGIAMRVATILKNAHHISPLKDYISIDGGLAQNPYFVQFLANITGKSIHIPPNKELSALGAALLARKGLGENTDWQKEEENQKMIIPKDINRENYLKKFEELTEKSRQTRFWSHQCR